MKHLLSISIILCFITLGCGSGNNKSSSSSNPPPPVLASITITTALTTVPLGATQSLTATGTYSDGKTRDLSDKVTWTSSDGNIATVSALGAITGLAMGAVMVTATSGSISSTIDLTVGSAALSEIDISPSAPNTPPNTMQQLAAVGRYTDGTAHELNNVTWTSSDESKLTISALGLASALATGTATVTATSGAITGSATVTVSGAQLVRIALLPYEPVTGIGVAQQFVMLGTFDDYGTHQLISTAWSSSQSNVASITSDGLVTPLLAGSSTITATVGTITNTTALTVLPATLSKVIVTPSTASVAVGTDQQLGATGYLTDGSLVALPVVDWTSSDNSIATVDSNGHVLAAATGSVVLSASVAGVTGSGSLSVSNAKVQSIVLAPAATSVPVLSLKQLYAIGTFSDGTSQDLSNIVTWSTNNLDRVMVNHRGVAATNATGTAKLSAALGDEVGYGDFTVSSLTVSSVAVLPDSISLPRGVKQQYSLISTLSDGSTVSLDAPHWYTSPITMATADSHGLVTARTPTIGKVYGETCCKTAHTQVTVTSAKAVSLAISAETLTVPNGAVQPLHAIATFDDGSQSDVSNAVHWTSSDTNSALVDGQGFLTGVSSASNAVNVTVTATFGPVDGNSQTVAGTNTAVINPGTVAGLAIVPPPSGAIALGGMEQLSATGSFSDGSTHQVPNLTWQSSDPTVAVVLPTGLVISTGKGSTVITASASGFSATTTVTVQ